MRHIISMSQRTDGMDVASIDLNGTTLTALSRNGATMAVARVAIDAGAADWPWVGVDAQTGAERLYGASLAGLAKVTISNPDRGQAKLVKWAPYEHAP